MCRGRVVLTEDCTGQRGWQHTHAAQSIMHTHLLQRLPFCSQILFSQLDLHAENSTHCKMAG